MSRVTKSAEKNKNKDSRTPLSLKITFLVSIIIAGLVILSLLFLNNRQQKMRFLSRYTYVKKMALNTAELRPVTELADIWLDEFLGQYTGTLVPSNVRLKDLTIDSIQKVDGETDTVRITFSAIKADDSSDYFDEWNPRYVNGRMQCDWIARFGIEKTENLRDGIYVISMVNNTRDITSASNDAKSDDETKENNDPFVYYRLSQDALSVSFDGGDEYDTVPVDVRNLPDAAGTDGGLEQGSFYLSREYTAFLYGGATINGERVPLSVVYTQDGGESWITSEVDQVFDVSYYYINMFSPKDGVITLGYARTDNQEYSKIYTTNDGGETWKTSFSGPLSNSLKGVLFTDERTAFFCYEYNKDTKDNLFVTRDGGANFTAVSFPGQELDSGAGNLTWEEVFKEATVPVYDADGVLTVYLLQGDDGTYQGGDIAAKYISEDLGYKWQYTEQVQQTVR